MPKGIWVEESLGVGGTAQPHIQMHPVYMWVQMAAQEVDGTSLHPSTWHI